MHASVNQPTNSYQDSQFPLQRTSGLPQFFLLPYFFLSFFPPSMLLPPFLSLSLSRNLPPPQKSRKKAERNSIHTQTENKQTKKPVKPDLPIGPSHPLPSRALSSCPPRALGEKPPPSLSDGNGNYKNMKIRETKHRSTKYPSYLVEKSKYLKHQKTEKDRTNGIKLSKIR